MTNEELKNMPTIIDTLLDEAITDSARQKVKDKLTEVCQLAIQALEAQPCDNCISREEAKQFLYERIDRLNDDELYDIFSRIIDDMYNELPPVKPKYTDEEIDKAQAVEQAYVDKMVELAVEETKRPKGKWIKIEYDVCTFIYKCSKCGMRVVNPYKYCPNCGSDNGGEADG